MAIAKRIQTIPRYFLSVFSWDGIGRLLVESIEKRDYPVTQACVLVVALSYVLVNLLTDMLYRLADPRVKFAH